jgi:hypothetical protein
MIIFHRHAMNGVAFINDGVTQLFYLCFAIRELHFIYLEAPNLPDDTLHFFQPDL